MNIPQLETPRLVLRELLPSDAERLLEIFSNADVARYTVVDLPRRKPKDVRKMILAWKKTSMANWAVCHKESGAVMGFTGLRSFSPRNQSAEAGLTIDSEFWNQGYATEALQAVVAYGFNERKLNRITGGHFAGNGASGRVQQKCGFQYEGTQRQSHRLNNGQFVDFLLYAIVREDYFPA